MLKIAGIELHDLHKSFVITQGREKQVLRGLNFCFKPGSFTVIVGLSGCGKTTLLRVVGGLEQIDGGQIKMRDIKVGIVFQEPRLMTWLNVRDNITFGLDEYEPDKISALIKSVGLSEFEYAMPRQLSGGMQQRTALARALAYEPDVLLMDEPFAALDYHTRAAMQDQLISMYGEGQKTIIFVTHSIDEALLLGQRVVVLNGGRFNAEYDLNGAAYPRDIFSAEMVAMKRDILNHMTM